MVDELCMICCHCFLFANRASGTSDVTQCRVSARDDNNDDDDDDDAETRAKLRYDVMYCSVLGNFSLCY